MKKARIFRILLFSLFVNSLFAQEALYHKLGHKYDFRLLLLEAPEHHFDIIYYQFAWSQPGKNRVKVHISQVQQDFPLFSMPIELQFTLPSRTEKKIVWVGKKRNTFDFTFQEEPLDVLFDPDGWILCEVIEYKKGMDRR